MGCPPGQQKVAVSGGSTVASIAVQSVLDFEVKVADCIASLLNVRSA